MRCYVTITNKHTWLDFRLSWKDAVEVIECLLNCKHLHHLEMTSCHHLCGYIYRYIIAIAIVIISYTFFCNNLLYYDAFPRHFKTMRVIVNTPQTLICLHEWSYFLWSQASLATLTSQLLPLIRKHFKLFVY